MTSGTNYSLRIAIAYCSLEQGQSAKVKECDAHFHVKE
jgi:hypothetical protein